MNSPTHSVSAEIPAGYVIHNPATSTGLNETRDCTVRALVNVTRCSYENVHSVLRNHGRKNRRGFRLREHLHDIGRDLGVEFKLVRRSGNVDRLIRDFPAGRFVVLVRGHAFAVIDGAIHDSWTPSKLCHIRGAWQLT